MKRLGRRILFKAECFSSKCSFRVTGNDRVLAKKDCDCSNGSEGAATAAAAVSLFSAESSTFNLPNDVPRSNFADRDVARFNSDSSDMI
jgi:hypothetical protein